MTLRVLPDVRSLRTARSSTRSNGPSPTCCAPGFRLVHYSLQNTHAHLIVEAHDAEALGRGMKAIGARLARAVNRVTKRRGPVLADRYHHRILPTPTEVRTALRYVLLNARRHAAKVRAAVSGPVRLDPASSARWFDGWRRERLPPKEENDDASGSPPVARPRLWLPAVGWRRHGLLDPADVPG